MELTTNGAAYARAMESLAHRSGRPGPAATGGRDALFTHPPIVERIRAAEMPNYRPGMEILVISTPPQTGVTRSRRNELNSSFCIELAGTVADRGDAAQDLLRPNSRTVSHARAEINPTPDERSAQRRAAGEGDGDSSELRPYDITADDAFTWKSDRAEVTLSLTSEGWIVNTPTVGRLLGPPPVLIKRAIGTPSTQPGMSWPAFKRLEERSWWCALGIPRCSGSSPDRAGASFR